MKESLLLFCLLLTACITRNITANTGIQEIKFGNGGGFTGKISTYTLTSESLLYQNKKELKKIKPKITLDLFRAAQELKDYTFNELGNIYLFIEIQGENGSNRIVWHHASSGINTKVVELNNALMSLTQNHQYGQPIP